MKVFLLRAGIDKNSCLEKATEIVDGLNYDSIHDRASMSSGLADADLFISDLELVDRQSIFSVINENKHHISERVQAGAVLLCFAGKQVSNCANYNWLVNLGADLAPENLEAEDIDFTNTYDFKSDLEKEKNNFFHKVIFRKEPASYFHRIASNKSGVCVGAYAKINKGHVFILPRHKDHNFFVKYFIDVIIPKLEIAFTIDSGSKEPIPEEIKNINVEGQIEIRQKIEEQKKIIEDEEDKLLVLKNKEEELEQWKELLWQTGIPLENIVKKFFEILGDLKLTKQTTDLVGEYNSKELFIEIKGNKGCIDHKNDFRQIEERKNYDANDPKNTIALLVGNPFRLQPLDKRPPDNDQDLFAKTSVPIAEALGIGLIWTKELYDIINDYIKNPEIDKKKILDGIMNTAGVYKYNK